MALGIKAHARVGFDLGGSVHIEARNLQNRRIATEGAILVPTISAHNWRRFLVQAEERITCGVPCVQVGDPSVVAGRDAIQGEIHGGRG